MVLTDLRAKQATHLRDLLCGLAKRLSRERRTGCKAFDDKTLTIYQLTKQDTTHIHPLILIISCRLEPNTNMYIPPQICPTLSILHR
jgi:hypothetical protein